MDARLRALLDKDEIRDVIMRFARGIDRRDWNLVRSCYHDDARDDHGAFEGGAEAYVAWLADNLPRLAERTMHSISNIIIELESDEVAHSEAYVTGYHRYRRQDGVWADFIGAGRYVDRFEKRDGSWKIADRLLLWEWVRDDPAGAAFEQVGLDGSALAWGEHWPTDPVYRSARGRASI